MGRGQTNTQTNTQTNGHRDSMTDPAQRAESVKTNINDNDDRNFVQLGFCKFKEGCKRKHFTELCETFQDAKLLKNVRKNTP